MEPTSTDTDHHPKLYTVERCANVYADACVRNEAGQLMLLSVFGRDTGIAELMARMQLNGPDSMREVILKGPSKESHTVYVADPRELTKLTGRLSTTLYGSLVHAWIYHPEIEKPDKGARKAWIIQRTDSHKQTIDMEERIWRAVCELSEIPLRPHWRDSVLEAIRDDMVFEMGQSNPTDSEVNPAFCRPIGPLQAVQLRLAENFADRVATLVKDGVLHLEPPGH